MSEECSELVVYDADGLPVEVPPENQEAWAKVEANKYMSPPTKRALKRVAGGETCDRAAVAESVDQRGIFRYAKRFGIIRLDHDSAIELERNVYYLSSKEQIRRLLEHPEKITDSILNAIRGTAMDKIQVHAKLSKEDATELVSELDKLARTIKESGATWELKVTPRDEADRAIDVTPSSST